MKNIILAIIAVVVLVIAYLCVVGWTESSDTDIIDPDTGEAVGKMLSKVTIEYIDNYDECMSSGEACSYSYEEITSSSDTLSYLLHRNNKAMVSMKYELIAWNTGTDMFRIRGGDYINDETCEFQILWDGNVVQRYYTTFQTGIPVSNQIPLFTQNVGWADISGVDAAPGDHTITVKCLGPLYYKTESGADDYSPCNLPADIYFEVSVE